VLADLVAGWSTLAMAGADDFCDELVVPIIEGVLSRSADSATVNVINPSNGKPLLVIPAGCEADVDQAVTSSRRVF
jgi:hypothetical protein